MVCKCTETLTGLPTNETSALMLNSVFLFLLSYTLSLKDVEIFMIKKIKLNTNSEIPIKAKTSHDNWLINTTSSSPQAPPLLHFCFLSLKLGWGPQLQLCNFQNNTGKLMILGTFCCQGMEAFENFGPVQGQQGQ